MGRTNSNRKQSVRYAWTVVLMQIGVMLVYNTPAMANPDGGVVVAGAAGISTSGNTVNVNQTSQRAVINWQGFSIANGEVTNFNMPNSNAAVLNRVVSGNPSAIYGTLNSNGKVYLINPNGILVGPTGQINTSSFIGSTLNVDTTQFMNNTGELDFAGTSGASVINQGTIRALEGDIYLIGANVQNHGGLYATNGVVGMAAGQDVRLVDSAHPHLSVRPTSQSFGGTGVHNTGTIEAMQAELMANGGNIYALAINNEGTIRATGSETIGGRVFLVSNGGKIHSSGNIVAKKGVNGGDVLIHAGGQVGSEIVVRGTIDVSGDEYGGTIGMKAESILLGGSTILLSGGIQDGVRLISLGDSSAIIADPKNGGFLSYTPGTTGFTILDDAGKIIASDDALLTIQGNTIKPDAGGSFTDLMFEPAAVDEYISFITFNLDEQSGGGAPTVAANATITFTVVLRKPVGPDQIVVLEESWANIDSSGKISIQATGGDLIKKITFNSDANGPTAGVTPFISQIKQVADLELATGSIIIQKLVTAGDLTQDFQFTIDSDATELPGSVRVDSELESSCS
jgi:filamentous hemagglutinin family protein